MENELIYIIGETLMLEIKEIANVTYPREYEANALKIETRSGKCYKLTLEDIEN